MSDTVELFTNDPNAGLVAEAFANTYGHSLFALAHDGGTIGYPHPAELTNFGGWMGL